MKNRKLITLLGVATLAVSVFVGCSSGEASAPEESTAAESPVGSETNSKENGLEEEKNEEGMKLVDGTYRIEYDEADEKGYRTFLEVTVADGAMAGVTFDEANEENTVNEEDQEADDALEAALMTAKSPEEFEQMIEGLPEGDTFKQLVTKLVEQMVAGNTETLVITK
ncbi:MAG: hypothetical protein ACRCWY_03010 [Cellulosilyticaceae bacterium]